MTSNNIIVARKVVQNNQEFLIGVFEIRQIKKFTRYTEHLVIGVEEVEEKDKVYAGKAQIKPVYNEHIQRHTNPTKVTNIADFLLNDPAAMFPTNLVIAIPKEVIDNYSEEGINVTITLNEIVAEELAKVSGDVYLTIIDGQHRVRGIEEAIERLTLEITEINKVLPNAANQKEWEDKLSKASALLNRLLSMELIVTFFIDPALEYQAMIFATINKTQTRVPENLVFSLFGLTKEDSPQKTSLEVVLALNGIENSPFFNRIKLVGGTYERGSLIPLSQATMVKSVLALISNSQREAETDRFKNRDHFRSNPKNLIFRKYYANNQDVIIVRILFSFFTAVQKTFKDNTGKSFWDLPESGRATNVLQTNVGFQALLKVLMDILVKVPEADRDKPSAYESYLTKASKLNIADDGEEKRYPFTSSTISTLYEDIIGLVL